MTYAHETKAFKELQRIKRLSAFNVSGYYLKIRVNQHKSVFQFDDGSDLIIYPSRSVGVAKLDRSFSQLDLLINK